MPRRNKLPNPRKISGGPITFEWLMSNTTPLDPPEGRGLKEPCKLWLGAMTAKGYASISENRIGRAGHRLAYAAKVGPIPPGRVLDHLCSRRICIEPTHLEPVPGYINTRRGAACLHGAPCRTCGGVRFAAQRRRRCLDCRAQQERAKRKKKRCSS